MARGASSTGKGVRRAAPDRQARVGVQEWVWWGSARARGPYSLLQSERQKAEAMQPSVAPFLAAKAGRRRQGASWCVFLATRLPALPLSRPPALPPSRPLLSSPLLSSPLLSAYAAWRGMTSKKSLPPLLT